MQPPAAILTLDRETRLASIGCMFQYISNKHFHDFLADKKGPIYAVEWSPKFERVLCGLWLYPGYCIVHE